MKKIELGSKSVRAALAGRKVHATLAAAIGDRFWVAETFSVSGLTKYHSTGNPDDHDDRPFDPSHLLKYGKIVLFGANHYASRLPDSGGWIVWDKRRGIEDAEWPMSEGELAWTNLMKGVRFYRHRWFGMIRDSERGEHFHPTQKPVALMKWIIHRWAPVGGVVLDPYCGSGPVLLAAQQLKRNAIGIEIDEKYCEIAARRLRQ